MRCFRYELLRTIASNEPEHEPQNSVHVAIDAGYDRKSGWKARGCFKQLSLMKNIHVLSTSLQECAQDFLNWLQEGDGKHSLQSSQLSTLQPIEKSIHPVH